MRETRNDDEEREMDNETEAAGDVFEMLKTDHRHVQDLFTRFEDADKRTRTSIAEEALTALEVHATLEEQLVYPAIAEVIEDEDAAAQLAHTTDAAQIVERLSHAREAEV